jgi:hypothetical protein
MIDTLFVANALTDTLKVIMDLSDNQSYLNKYSPLLIAFGVVIISSVTQIIVAIIHKNQYEKNRITEQEKIENDLYKEIDLVWLDKFEILMSKYLSLMENLVKEIREKQKPIESKQISSAYFFNRTRILLHISRMSFNQTDLVNEIENDLKKLLEIENVDEQIHFITEHMKVIVEISHDIINDVLDIKEVRE